jgi:hypothetical protein
MPIKPVFIHKQLTYSEMGIGNIAIFNRTFINLGEKCLLSNKKSYISNEI